MKKIFFVLMVAFLFLLSCNSNSGEKTTPVKTENVSNVVDTTNDAARVRKNEELKARIESMAVTGKWKRQEIVLKETDANESIKQKWMKMDVYSDSTGTVKRIKLYPHTGISERSEEFYYDNGQLFFVYISDNGVKTENNDEGKPGKEFHFSSGRLIKYDDKSGDKEIDIPEERKMYATELPMESDELLQLVKEKGNK